MWHALIIRADCGALETGNCQSGVWLSHVQCIYVKMRDAWQGFNIHGVWDFYAHNIFEIFQGGF